MKPNLIVNIATICSLLIAMPLVIWTLMSIKPSAWPFIEPLIITVVTMAGSTALMVLPRFITLLFLNTKLPAIGMFKNGPTILYGYGMYRSVSGQQRAKTMNTISTILSVLLGAGYLITSSIWGHNYMTYGADVMITNINGSHLLAVGMLNILAICLFVPDACRICDRMDTPRFRSLLSNSLKGFFGLD